MARAAEGRHVGHGECPAAGVRGAVAIHIVLRDGVRLHLAERGAGEPLLLLHGFAGSSASWGEEILSPLARQFRVVAVDLLGHGASDAPGAGARYGISAVVADLLEVLDTLRIPSATWIGYSMGGRLALAAAVVRPERVRRLVLESASPGLVSETDRHQRRAEDGALADRIERDGVEAFADEWERLPLFESRTRLPEATRAQLRRRLLDNRAHALAAWLRSAGTGVQASYWDDLLHVAIPTLLIAGGADTKFRGIADEMQRRLPQAAVTVVPDAGHTVHLERPAAWLDALRGWLERSG